MQILNHVNFMIGTWSCFILGLEMMRLSGTRRIVVGKGAAIGDQIDHLRLILLVLLVQGTNTPPEDRRNLDRVAGRRKSLDSHLWLLYFLEAHAILWGFARLMSVVLPSAFDARFSLALSLRTIIISTSLLVVRAMKFEGRVLYQ